MPPKIVGVNGNLQWTTGGRKRRAELACGDCDIRGGGSGHLLMERGGMSVALMGRILIGNTPPAYRFADRAFRRRLTPWTMSARVSVW